MEVPSTTVLDLGRDRSPETSVQVDKTLQIVRRSVRVGAKAKLEDHVVALHVVGTGRFYARVTKRAERGPARVVRISKVCRGCVGSGFWVHGVECPACGGSGRVEW